MDRLQQAATLDVDTHSGEPEIQTVASNEDTQWTEFMFCLPAEIVVHILRMTSGRDITRCSMVCLCASAAPFP
jgi:hypothetical protein